MGKLGGTNQFDITDVSPSQDEMPIDTLDAVLDIAGEVLAEFGTCPGTTRIERMARFIACHLGEPVNIRAVGALAKIELEHTRPDMLYLVPETATVDRVGGLIGSPKVITGSDGARALAVALLKAADLADAA